MDLTFLQTGFLQTGSIPFKISRRFYLYWRDRKKAKAASHSGAKFQSYLHAACEQCPAGGLQKFHDLSPDWF